MGGKTFAKLAWVWITILVLLASLLWACAPGSKRRDEPHVRLTCGPIVQVATQTIGPDGGTIMLDKPDDPLDGLTVEVPEGAYDSPVTFTISQSPILEFESKNDANLISPLITIDNGAGYASVPMLVTIPVAIPEGHFAMAFIYDEETGRIEGLPTIDQDEDGGSLTFATRHFSSILALSEGYSVLDTLNNLPTNGFKPGVDTWNLENRGSYIASGGYCRGMSLTAMWYYLYEKPVVEEDLWRKEYDNGLGTGYETPDFWQDDRWAIQLCSAANSIRMTKTAGDDKMEYEALAEDLLGRKLKSRDERAFYCLAFSLLCTGEPQMVHVYSTESMTGHVLVCYKIKDHTLYVADPNYPDKSDATIEFKNGSLGPYVSAKNLEDIEEGKYATYDWIFYDGETCFFDLSELRELWTEYESGNLDDRFPSYDIWAIELDDNGDETDRYILDLISGIESGSESLRFELEAQFEGELEVYRFGDLSTPLPGSKTTLNQGGNILGFYVKGKKEGTFWWAGFDWVNVSFEEDDEAEGVFSISDCECSGVGISFDDGGLRNEGQGLWCSFEKSECSGFSLYIEPYNNTAEFEQRLKDAEESIEASKHLQRPIIIDGEVFGNKYYLTERHRTSVPHKATTECKQYTLYRGSYLITVAGYDDYDTNEEKYLSFASEAEFREMFDNLEECAKASIDGK
jgi:hypothetical protein